MVSRLACIFANTKRSASPSSNLVHRSQQRRKAEPVLNFGARGFSVVCLSSENEREREKNAQPRKKEMQDVGAARQRSNGPRACRCGASCARAARALRLRREKVARVCARAGAKLAES
ncbi:hypothetical protein QAD02_014045 [Eretmocerus hayati]|uniref:Uncharacterized protein n=1 Tax=Eretmocerus hayati TaxID=131215 RepID=A0ACC2P571_9HYME|nr:hypothetical protein QAD02_014045 [Eretmocerus hayati]